jgi:glycogen debranching enzyme
VTLVEGSTFAISLPSGDMLTGFPHGLFHRDTRFLSTMRLRVNGEWPEPLSARAVYPFSAAMVLRAPPAPGDADSKLLLRRDRHVGQGMREDLVVRNYGTLPAFCRLELELDVDFADLFEVKAGNVQTDRRRELVVSDGHLTWRYERGAFRRGTVIDFSHAVHLRNGTACFEVVVPPGDEWGLCMQLTPVIDDVALGARHRCGERVEWSEPVERLESWRRSRPVIEVEHPVFQTMLDRSAQDLAALRISDAEFPGREVIAAGAPWFMTLFGRDSLITSWMALPVDPDLALGTLQTLARFQGSTVDDRTEEQPGRILHEMRFGETAELSLGPGRAYYGSVDATPLFVMLLGELHRWGLSIEELRPLLPAADRALTWIDEFGDRDGDGYVEYLRMTPNGLANQGWKDSFDAIRFVDGNLAEPPVALCEVQGYVYSAFLARAAIADSDGDVEHAVALRARGASLKERFNRDFWLEDRGWFALGLDAHKRPIDALTSNIGHCLWTGIVDDDKVEQVAAHLSSREMSSGWGIRTLASSMTGYNPVSYHNGSVWPHDSTIAAAGLARTGRHDELRTVAEGLVAAAPSFSYRLPELFAGLGRDETPFPVRYPTSCSPQAWAASSPLLLLRALLGLEPDLPNGIVRVHPRTADWLGRVRINGIALGTGRLSFEVRDGAVIVNEAPDGVTVETEHQ